MATMEEELPSDDVDFISNISYTSLNYILDCFVPLNFLSVDDGPMVNSVDSTSEGITATLKKHIVPRNAAQQTVKGFLECPEAVNVSKTEAFTFSTDQNIPGNYQVIGHIVSTDTHVGYLRVEAANQEDFSYPKQDQYILSEHFKNLTLTSENKEKEDTHLEGSEEDKANNATSADKTALAGTWTAHAFPCPSWPEEASGFKTRHRVAQWPDAALVSEIMEDGCVISPTAHALSSTPDVEWMYLFPITQQKLLQSVTDTQAQAYRLFYLICEQCSELTVLLSSSHLRTVFLWSCERLPVDQWSEQNLAKCVLLLFDTLLHFLISRCIPHYFIEEWNTVDHLDEDTLAKIAMKISSLRQNLIPALLEFDSQFRMSFWPCSIKMADILEPVVNSSSSFLASEEITSKIIKSGSRLVIILLKESSAAEGKANEEEFREERFRNATHALQRLERYIAEPNRGLDFYAGMAKEAGDPSIPFLEYLLKRFPSDPASAAHHGNLACYFYNKASKGIPSDERECLIEKVHHHFQQASEHDHCSDATLVDYANFLCRENSATEGVALLMRVIKGRKFTAWNSYGEDELHTVDSKLQSEIRTYKILTLPSLAMAYYLLLLNCQSCSPAFDQEKSLQSFLEFKDVCSHILHLYGRQCQSTRSAVASCFVLLGIAGELVEEYEISLQSFEKALEIAPEHPTATIQKQVVESVIEAIAVDLAQQS